MKNISFTLISLLTFCLISMTVISCQEVKTYEIGVSQCSEDDWRSLLNTEIQREARFQGDVNVEVLSANDDSKKQIKDIEEFISEGKDLIIVAPNVAADVRPAVEKAFDKGIPVILIDRKTDGEKYTAFIGADNNEIGKQIGEYIEMDAKGQKADVIELCGLEGSSPAIGRHEGFMKAIKENAAINLLASANANWNEDEGERAMDSLLKVYPKIDYVYAQNDRMGLGAYKAIEKAGRAKEIKILGVDALVSDGGGVDQVMEGKFLATHMYPTGGPETIILAKQILTGEKYDKFVTLPAAMVDKSNARVMKLQYQSMKTQDEIYQKIERQTDLQLEKINQQKLIMWGTILMVVVLGVAILMISKFYREKKTNDDMLISQLRSLVEQHQLARENPVAHISVTAPVLEEINGSGSNTVENEEEFAKQEEEIVKQDNAFLCQIEDIIEKRLSDSELSVNSIADELCISRVQLYRKIKAVSDRNVNEIIRRARLEKAKTMLKTTNLSISEIAYSVGFSSPSYFTKCYKDYFGKSPSEK